MELVWFNHKVKPSDHQPESVHKIAGKLDNNQLFLHYVQKNNTYFCFVFLCKSKYDKKVTNLNENFTQNSLWNADSNSLKYFVFLNILC